MATTTEAAILEALFARVATLDVGGLPISWPNLSFAPPDDGKFLRVAMIPNATDRLCIGSDDPHQHQGLLQVSVCWPIDKGEDAPREIAGQVAEHFPADLQLGDLPVRVTQAPSVGPLMTETSRVQIPVTISWQAFA